MSELTVSGSNMGSALTDVLMCEGIEPGTEVGYQTCKTLYTSHPLGKKMVDSPIKMAQSQKRKIVVADSPEDRVVRKFLDQWKADKCDDAIAKFGALARTYGISALALVIDKDEVDKPLDLWKLAGAEISYNGLDPLNTAGSFVLSQDPNSIHFQKPQAVRVQGKTYHLSRTRVLMHEQPLYIDYTPSAYGYSGRSVFQRALFPMKTFIQTMRTDDMVSRKAGLLIAKMGQSSSVVDKAMMMFAGFKRNLLKEAGTDNVVTIGPEDEVTTLNMQNLEAPAKMARDNAIDNIASAADMPALLLKADTMTSGFGEGTEDAKMVAGYIDGIREWLQDAYDFCDLVTMHRAWTEDFFATMRKLFPEKYSGMDYRTAFYEWKNSFTAEWPSLITEPDSEKVRVDEIRAKSVLGAAEVLLPRCDQENAALIYQWIADTFNEQKLLFPKPLELDYEALAAYTPPQAQIEQEPDAPKPIADSADQWVARANEPRVRFLPSRK